MGALRSVYLIIIKYEVGRYNKTNKVLGEFNLF